MEEWFFGAIMAGLAGLAVQNYKNHGCIKKLEGSLNTHLAATKKD